jgi:hypothetical protein
MLHQVECSIQFDSKIIVPAAGRAYHNRAYSKQYDNIPSPRPDFFSVQVFGGKGCFKTYDYISRLQSDIYTTV